MLEDLLDEVARMLEEQQASQISQQEVEESAAELMKKIVPIFLVLAPNIATVADIPPKLNEKQDGFRLRAWRQGDFTVFGVSKPKLIFREYADIPVVVLHASGAAVRKEAFSLQEVIGIIEALATLPAIIQEWGNGLREEELKWGQLEKATSSFKEMCSKLGAVLAGF